MIEEIVGDEPAAIERAVTVMVPAYNEGDHVAAHKCFSGAVPALRCHSSGIAPVARSTHSIGIAPGGLLV